MFLLGEEKKQNALSLNQVSDFSMTLPDDRQYAKDKKVPARSQLAQEENQKNMI